MQIKPILAALRRHKAGTTLDCAADRADAGDRVQRAVHHPAAPGADGPSQRRAGVGPVRDPERLAGEAPAQDTDARMRADMQALRQLGSVQEASSTNSFPLRGSGWDNFVRAAVPTRSR